MKTKSIGMKVYIVTSGEYSDYRINAVFTTKEKANEYIQQNGTDYQIEKYNLNEEVVKEEKLWRVQFPLDRDFCIDSHRSVSATSWECNENFKDTCIVSSIGSSKYFINFYIVADAMDRAIKVASERFMAIRANEYFWIRLTRPYELYGSCVKKFERFNVKTNEFTRD